MVKPETKTDRQIEKAEEIRDNEHRLSTGQRLRTLTELVEFVHAKGLISELGGNELPSLVSAVLGRPWKPSAKGFTAWTDWWSLKIEGQRLSSVLAEFERRDDVLASRIFRRSKTLVSNRLWPIIAPIVRHHRNLAKRGKLLSPLESKLLGTVESEKAIRTDWLRKKLKLEDSKNDYRFHRSLAKLESYGLIVGAEDPNPERHMHANIWQTWENRAGGARKTVEPSYQAMFTKLLERTIDGAVLVREDAIPKLFEWKVNTREAIEELLAKGSIIRSGAFLVPSRVSNIP